MWRRLLRTDAGLAGLILRLGLGLVMFPHGAQKVFGWFGGGGFSATLDFFTGMGIPSFLGVIAILTEFLGSMLLIAGALSRIAALGIGSIMVVAIATVHWQHGFFMNWYGQKQGEGFEYHLLAIAIALALVIVGGGRWSMDRWWAGRGEKPAAPTAPSPG